MLTMKQPKLDLFSRERGQKQPDVLQLKKELEELKTFKDRYISMERKMNNLENIVKSRPCNRSEAVFEGNFDRQPEPGVLQHHPADRRLRRRLGDAAQPAQRQLLQGPRNELPGTICPQEATVQARPITTEHPGAPKHERPEALHDPLLQPAADVLGAASHSQLLGSRKQRAGVWLPPARVDVGVQGPRVRAKRLLRQPVELHFAEQGRSAEDARKQEQAVVLQQHQFEGEFVGEEVQGHFADYELERQESRQRSKS